MIWVWGVLQEWTAAQIQSRLHPAGFLVLCSCMALKGQDGRHKTDGLCKYPAMPEAGGYTKQPSAWWSLRVAEG